MSRIDALFDFLTAPGVRRIRRWAFVVTVPAATALVVLLGLRGGFVLIAAEVALLLVLVVAAARLGGERGEVVLDFVMHPVARRAMKTELVILSTIPRALIGRRRRDDALSFTYHSGSMELGFALALIPVAVVELGIIELLLPASWLWVKVAIAFLSVYGVVVLVSLALGLRTNPHCLRGQALETRLGQLYRATVPLAAIESVEQRRERVGDRTRVLLRDDAALLLVNGRVDLHLTLSTAVLLERPLGEPVGVRRISIAVDEPRELATRLSTPERAVALLEKPDGRWREQAS